MPKKKKTVHDLTPQEQAALGMFMADCADAFIEAVAKAPPFLPDTASITIFKKVADGGISSLSPVVTTRAIKLH